MELSEAGADRRQEVALSPKEFELLRVLLVRAGRWSREGILHEVWNEPDMRTTKTLDMHMSWLRRKIGDPPRIATVRRVGFRFNPAEGQTGRSTPLLNHG